MASPPYKIQSINFKGCGDGYRGGILKEEGFDKILKAIGQSGLKDSLEKVRTTDLKIKKKRVLQLLDANGLEDVDVVMEEEKL